jgi:hypothetical protein
MIEIESLSSILSILQNSINFLSSLLTPHSSGEDSNYSILHETFAFFPLFCPTILKGLPEKGIASRTINMLNMCHLMAFVGK